MDEGVADGDGDEEEDGLMDDDQGEEDEDSEDELQDEEIDEEQEARDADMDQYVRAEEAAKIGSAVAESGAIVPVKTEPSAELDKIASSISEILSRPVKGKGLMAEAPVLSERRDLLQAVDERRQEEKLRRRLAHEKKKLREAAHQPVDVLQKDFERQLKKIATRGVVKLFNAVMDYRQRQPRIDAEHKREELKEKAKRHQQHKARRLAKKSNVEADERGKKAFLAVLNSSKNAPPAAKGSAFNVKEQVKQEDVSSSSKQMVV
ncbi:unnamed protein product [Vitrella brassicaformis CCMP3155]|uniref:Rrp15p-domain-containing protein n=1 Tax=Vitrella brassicaformis (strain CCMP3155) TaxID=1169540 RepID=A0A0G4GWG8_VITBC|nr:unnamed protein product [Vitrella brassicaformis CCMP3155]|eukprot:CEM35281.1 unnamed protein product [Vitrella brassicaformis CCMP3155]